MADKEERILCNSYDGIQAKLMANNNIGMTRQEAIERIAKRLIFEGVNYFECHEIAKWCLDALLEGVKK